MKPTTPVFLARQGYRLRRAMDAARFLPLLGAFLFLLPVLWSGGTTRRGIIYIFALWLALIVASFMLSRVLRPAVGGDTGGGDDLAGNGERGEGLTGTAGTARDAAPLVRPPEGDGG